MSNVTAHFFTKLRNVMINMLEKLSQNSLLLEINICFFSIWCVISTEILLNKKIQIISYQFSTWTNFICTRTINKMKCKNFKG